MLYLFQRIILNNFQWTRPSPGRLGPYGEGDYVRENGFGHEDWNFSRALLIDGHIYGYCYYRPVQSKKPERFNIAFATYTNQQWYLVGFYLKCSFVENPPVDERILRQKMNDLRQLGPSLGKSWRDKSDSQFLASLKEDTQWLKWQVDPDDAVRLPQPAAIPKRIFNTQNYRIVKPTELSEGQFEKLWQLAQTETATDDYANDDAEFPEGREVERTHKTRERNPALIKAAKDAFKRRYGRLYCQACEVDFLAKYGEIGRDFIEAHHMIPVGELPGEVKTKISDIALVCPNCHRMLHKRRPWIKNMKDLPSLVYHQATPTTKTA